MGLSYIFLSAPQPFPAAHFRRNFNKRISTQRILAELKDVGGRDILDTDERRYSEIKVGSLFFSFISRLRKKLIKKYFPIVFVLSRPPAFYSRIQF